MKRILLIEDNKDIRENTAEILELANYDVLTAENGKAGVELAIKEKPDLIICDIMMPVLDGYGALHLINKQPEIKNTPFIFLSAKAERSEIRKGMTLGADDYITKPFDEADLLDAVEIRLKKADMLRKEVADGLQGLGELVYAINGKNIMQAFTEERNLNKYKIRQIIYQEKNRPTELFFIQKGKVRTYKSNDLGKELTMAIYGEGDFLGYNALMEGGSYRDSAMAIEDTELVVIPKGDFDVLMNGSKEVAEKFTKLLARNVSEIEEQLLGMAYNSVRKKVAEALMAIQNKYNATRKSEFAIDISWENLATFAGTATETMIRTLGDFREEKLIDVHDGKILILEEKKLVNMMT